MDSTHTRRHVLTAIGLAAAAAAAPSSGARAEATAARWLPERAGALRELTERLASLPRRRDFRSVPMILDDPSQWDHEALQAVIAYRGGPKQAWDNTDLGGPWLNLMRNALNAQVWSFRHPDFLAVSVTHGSAGLALLDQAMWNRYQLARLAGGGFQSNTLIAEPQGPAPDLRDHQDPHGAYSSRFTSIPALQRRGVVFMACHNALWETASKLAAMGTSPDTADVPALAAELTNHLVPGVILTPGAVGTLPELQQAGFHYAK